MIKYNCKGIWPKPNAFGVFLQTKRIWPATYMLQLRFNNIDFKLSNPTNFSHLSEFRVGRFPSTIPFIDSSLGLHTQCYSWSSNTDDSQFYSLLKCHICSYILMKCNY